MPLRILCETCLRRYRWVRSQCPHCFQPNGKRLTLIVGVILVLAVTSAAIWFTLHLLMDSGTSEMSETEPSALKRIFATPAPDAQPEVDFKK